MADALDLKSSGGQPPCGFDSRLGYLTTVIATGSDFHYRTHPSAMRRCYLGCYLQPSITRLQSPER